MTPQSKAAMQKAAEGVAILPAGFENLKIKDSFPNKQDWDDFNNNLWLALNKLISADELNDYWENNSTFEIMGQHIDESCGF